MDALARRRLATVIVLASLALAGRGRAADEPANLGSLLQSPEPLAAALRARFGTDVRIRSLSVQAESAEIEVQDPKIPAYLNRYSFENGVLGAPEPVQAGRNLKALEATLFPLADVDLSVLPRLLADARRRAETADAKVTQALIERTEGYGEYATWGPPLVRVHVHGPRGGALVEYRLDGRHRHTNRW